MPIITFVRHCESEYNRKNIFCGRLDSDVTIEGLEEAQKCDLTNEKFDFFYCSKQKRTRKTLKAMFPNVKPIEDNRLATRYLGDWEGKLKSTIDTNLVDLYKKGLYTPPNAETPDEIDMRICNFIKDLFEKYEPSQKILVVTSNGIIRAIKRIYFQDAININTDNLGSIVLTNKEYLEWRKENDCQL